MSSSFGKSRLARLTILGITFSVGLGLGFYLRRPMTGGPEVHEAETLYYCPMHPQYTSSQPGECPICNMTLVAARPAGEREESPPPVDLPPGSINLSQRKRQLIGVRYGQVEEGPVMRSLRAVGKVAYDETRIARVHPKVPGWIEEVYVDFTGKPVNRGEPLVTLYSPELLATQNELLIARNAGETLGPSLYQATRERLRLWDIDDEQIRHLEDRGVPLRTLTLKAPAGGVVTARNAFPGQRVEPGTELYAIADLSRVWVIAELYEDELPRVRLGQRVTVSLAYDPGRSYAGRVSFIYPEVDPATRTAKLRIEVPNPALELKPEMYANVELEVSYGTQITVPDSAVVDTGEEQVVFLAHEGGYFEPRRVDLGGKVGDRYLVREGVRPGDRIVVSGTFLIDSESRLKSSLAGMSGAAEHAGHAATPKP